MHTQEHWWLHALIYLSGICVGVILSPLLRELINRWRAPTDTKILRLAHGLLAKDPAIKSFRCCLEGKGFLHLHLFFGRLVAGGEVEAKFAALMNALPAKAACTIRITVYNNLDEYLDIINTIKHAVES